MYRPDPWVRRLLVANLLVFLISETLLVDPSFLSASVFDPVARVEHPWTFVTYSFLHVNLPHLIFKHAGVVHVRRSGRGENWGGGVPLLLSAVRARRCDVCRS